MWPFKPREVRESQPFTDAIVNAITAQAEGTTAGDPTAIAALEGAAGLYARCFAGAEVDNPTVTPAVRALIARDLIRRGESVHLVEVRANRVAMIPAGSWDVRGQWREESWWYRVDLFGPSGNIPGLCLPLRWFTPATRWTQPARGWVYRPWVGHRQRES